jgi:hypothetical protein
VGLPDGSAYVVDAGCNCIWHLSAEGEISLYIVWDDTPVPTAIDIAPDGDLIIGFLSPGPFEVGTARVERWLKIVAGAGFIVFGAVMLWGALKPGGA